jgi:DNA replication protein DnaC
MTDNQTRELTSDTLMARARALGLHGLLADWQRLGHEPWLPNLLSIEEEERKRRSLERRLASARIGEFKPMADYDWKWPRKINREAVEEAVNGHFMRENSNIVIVGPTGVSKTMIAKNVAHNAVVDGRTVRFTTASAMLSDLAEQDSPSALARRLSSYCKPDLLCVDEVGYLSCSARDVDLLYAVVSGRYESKRPILVVTNKTFERWADVFPSACAVVTLVDRLVHRCELIDIAAESYRANEAKERSAARAKERAARRRNG